MPKRDSRFIAACLCVAGALWAGSVSAGAWDEILKAAEDNNTDAVIGLLDRGMDVNTSDRDGTTLLMIASRNGNQALVDFLLRNRANPLKRNKFGDSAILVATIAGQLAVVQELVDFGVPINEPGWEPLHYAAVAGNADVARLLIGRGAPLNARAPNGQTPLMLAVQEGQSLVAQLLVQAGADVSLTDGSGRTAADLAKAKGAEELVKLLDGASK